ncbi:MAG: hypothetical protein R6V04_00415 [bacterium]
MKRLLIITLVCILYLPLAAQEREEETLISGDVENGWSVGTYVGLSSFNGQSTIIDGFRAEWIFNGSWIIGWHSYKTKGSNLDAPISSADNEIYMDIEYKGMIIGKMFKPDKLIHWGVEGLIGWGDIDYHQENSDKEWREDYFYAVQASVFAEINIASWFRIMTSAGYRIVQSVDRQGLANSDISGPVDGITFRFGNF